MIQVTSTADAPARPGTRTPVAALRGVGRTYPGPPPVEALRPTDLELYEGDYVAVVGPSGSGKSTLLNILGLLDRPDCGTYEFDGVDTGSMQEVERTALRGRHIGFVFQSFHLLALRTALENVMVAQVYSGVPRARRRDAAARALKQVDLGHRMNALPTTLSGGERQRVAIARALVNRPRLVLCDEPTGNLDSTTTGTVLGILDTLREDGTTLVVITHDPLVAARADRQVTLSDGALHETPPVHVWATS